MRHRFPFALALIALATACAPMPAQPELNPSVPLDSDGIRAALAAPGASTITGQAFTRTVGGEVRYGAGSTILLLPHTGYVEQCVSLLRQNANTSCGQSLFHAGRRTVGDGEGRFRFDKVQPGKYYLETAITWGVPTQWGIQQTGGVFRQWVTVENDGDTVEVLLH